MGLKRLVLGMAAAATLFGVARADMPTCHGTPVAFDSPQDRVLLGLGRDLFYDPILSGNKTVACATCHHPAFGTSDAVPLSLGDGGIGLGPKRRVDPANVPEQRIPRNAQGLFNLAYPEFSVLFHDGRVEKLSDGTIRTPLGPVADDGGVSVLAALSAFPVISPDEMAGHYSENPVAQAVRRGLLSGPDGAYQILANRVAGIDAYRAGFRALSGEALGYDQIARALAAFMAHEWRADQSAFDQYLCKGAIMGADEMAGMQLFYGKAGCSNCHAGRFQTDHDFHAIAMPQFGPGKAERFEDHARDVGRMRVTGRAEDAYHFRTPSLRNVALTAPYGHTGAYPDLLSMIRHHLDPVTGLRGFDGQDLALPPLTAAVDFKILSSKADLRAIADANALAQRPLSDQQVDQIIAFLHALTDRAGIDGRLGVPDTVPSGLPVPRP